MINNLETSDICKSKESRLFSVLTENSRGDLV